MIAPDVLRPDERHQLELALVQGLQIALKKLPALRSSDTVPRVLLLCSDPQTGPIFAVGFMQGFADGFVEGAGLWRDEFKAMLRLVGVGTVVGVAEFFVRPVAEDNPQGLLPQSRAALEQLNTLRTLKPVLLWLESVGAEQALATLRELIPSAEEVAEMLAVAAEDWLLKLCELAPDANRMGAQCGRLFGRIALELIRADLEPFSFGLAGALESGADAGPGATP